MKPRSLLVDMIHTLLAATLFALLFGGLGWALVRAADATIRTPGLTILGGLLGFAGALVGLLGIACAMLGVWSTIAIPLWRSHIRCEFAVSPKWVAFNGWWDGWRRWGFAVDVLHLQLGVLTIEGR